MPAPKDRPYHLYYMPCNDLDIINARLSLSLRPFGGCGYRMPAPPLWWVWSFINGPRRMGNSSSEDNETTMIPSSSTVSGALSSLWSTSSEKDDTCVQWGLGKKERIIGFFSSLCLGLICFGLVRSSFSAQLYSAILLGICTDPSHSAQVTEVCCTLYSGKPL